MTQNSQEKELDPQIPIKLKLYLTAKERQAYRLAANLVGKESIADYLAHAIQTYTSFLIRELQTQVAAKDAEAQAAVFAQSATSEAVDVEHTNA
jgi:hypothetical protein